MKCRPILIKIFKDKSEFKPNIIAVVFSISYCLGFGLHA